MSALWAYFPWVMVMAVPLLTVCKDAGGTLGPCAEAQCAPAQVMADSFPTPLTEAGGLYGGNSNRPPSSHLAAGIRAAELVPESGAVFATVGMSNTLLEFQALMARSAGATDAVIAPTACWGCVVSAWDTETGRGWVKADNWLRSRGLGPEDVDVVWLKVTRLKDQTVTTDDLERILRVLRSKWPNVRQVFVSDRIYTGYLGAGIEPEGGWNAGPAIREFVLNHLSETEPWVGWGPYLWADGETARKDGLAWLRADYQEDMLHPGPTGASKVANLLLEFFSSAPEAAWFPRGSS